MKFRNKKTGETFNAIIREASDGNDDYELVVCDLDAYKRLNELPLKSAHAVISDRYKSLAQLNEEWEDHELTVPKISDAEWRCIVRKWYKLNELKGLIRVKLDSKNYKIIGWREGEDFDGQEIDIPLNVLDKSIGRIDKYSIDELCGEETPEPKEPTFIDLDERIREKEEE